MVERWHPDERIYLGKGTRREGTERRGHLAHQEVELWGVPYLVDDHVCPFHLEVAQTLVKQERGKDLYTLRDLGVGEDARPYQAERTLPFDTGVDFAVGFTSFFTELNFMRYVETPGETNLRACGPWMESHDGQRET